MSRARQPHARAQEEKEFLRCAQSQMEIGVVDPTGGKASSSTAVTPTVLLRVARLAAHAPAHRDVQPLKFMLDPGVAARVFPVNDLIGIMPARSGTSVLTTEQLRPYWVPDETTGQLRVAEEKMDEATRDVYQQMITQHELLAPILVLEIGEDGAPEKTAELECLGISLEDYLYDNEQRIAFLRQVAPYTDMYVRERWLPHIQDQDGRPVVSNRAYLKSRNFHIYAMSERAIYAIDDLFARAEQQPVFIDTRCGAPCMMLCVKQALAPIPRAQVVWRVLVSRALARLQRYYREVHPDLEIANLWLRVNVTIDDKDGTTHMFLSLVRPHDPGVRAAKIDVKRELVPVAPTPLTPAQHAKLEAKKIQFQADAITSITKAMGEEEQASAASAPATAKSSPLAIARATAAARERAKRVSAQGGDKDEKADKGDGEQKDDHTGE